MDSVKRSTYFRTFGGLLLLTAATFALSFVPLGPFQMPVALAIAAAKALLVLLFFMHLIEHARINAVVLIVSLLLVGTFIALTAADVATRAPGAAVIGTRD